jgi:hypothetical protein
MEQAMNLPDIRAELARAMALLDSDLDQAHEALRRALSMLDELRARSTTWTVEEILAREG